LSLDAVAAKLTIVRAVAWLAVLAASVAAGEEPALLGATRAGDAARVRTLLRTGADPDAATASGWTALMQAAEQGRRDIALALLDAGADPDARDRARGTALDVAERAGRADVVRLLRARGARGSGKSVGDTVCVRKWAGEGFCGVVESVEATRRTLRVSRLVGCAGACAPDPDCSASRPVGGASGIAVGDRVSVRSECLTDTGVP
jgi:hypothetical protein